MSPFYTTVVVDSKKLNVEFTLLQRSGSRGKQKRSLQTTPVSSGDGYGGDQDDK